jgi:hypothetical protein
MQTFHLNSTPDNSFQQARAAAVGKAREMFAKPVIVAWKDDNSGKFAPEIPGGKGDRWHDYGEHNDGKLELQVGDKFHFIFTDASDFDEPDLNVATLEHNGEEILCLNGACTEDDRKHQGYFAGGGVGG